MIEDIKITWLKAPFSKWLVMDKGVHLMPEQYTPSAKNIRIRNGTTTKRNWYSRVVEKWIYTEPVTETETETETATETVTETETTTETLTETETETTTETSTDTETETETEVEIEVTDKYIDNMISDWDDLYALCDGKFYKVKFDTSLTMEKATAATFSSDVFILKYWKYLFFLDEETAKGYSLDTTKITPDTTTWGTALTVSEDAYFRFWEVYKQNVYLAGGKDKANILYKSRAWTKTNPEHILDFSGSWSDALYFKSKIMWLSATREQLFVFTEDSIEILSYTESWGVLTMVSVPIAWSNQPANPRLVVKTDDLVFFRTRDNQMKSLNYMQWVTDRVVGDVSHRPNLSIKDFTDTLDEDQSNSFGYYDRWEKTIHWHLKQKWEPVPNIVLVYDINTDSFFIDTNKYFSCVAWHDNKYYAGSSFSTIIYQDNHWATDDDIPIERERKSALLSVGSPDYRKEFRQVNVYGEKDDDADIMVTVLVDWLTAFNGIIKASGWAINWMATNLIADDMVGFETKKSVLEPFEYVITKGNMRARGKNIQVVFKWASNWDFCLSWMEIWYKDLYDNKNSDKAKPNI